MKGKMTNFEKWKRDMTAENFLEIFHRTGCVGCPAKEVCKVTEGCGNAFRKWAGQTEGEK
jgi:hypothetical protein